MSIRYRPGVTREPWTPRGLEVLANIEERTRLIALEINGRNQSTLDRFAKPTPSFYVMTWN